jgi:hypothetical protein
MMEIPPIMTGCKRQWLRCRKCGRIQYYDYLPGSLSNPIMTTACGHGLAERDLGCDQITPDEAMIALSKKETTPVAGQDTEVAS